MMKVRMFSKIVILSNEMLAERHKAMRIIYLIKAIGLDINNANLCCFRRVLFQPPPDPCIRSTPGRVGCFMYTGSSFAQPYRTVLFGA